MFKRLFRSSKTHRCSYCRRKLHGREREERLSDRPACFSCIILAFELSSIDPVKTVEFFESWARRWGG